LFQCWHEAEGEGVTTDIDVLQEDIECRATTHIPNEKLAHLELSVNVADGALEN
jgi:hypothetical protein